MQKSILITGASGFVGRFLVETAVKKGFHVWAGLRHSSSPAVLALEGVEAVYLDYSSTDSLLTSLQALAQSQQPPTYVIHTAGLTKTCSKKQFEEVNNQYTQRLVQALEASALDIHKFVFLSSLAAVGPGDANSMRPLDASHRPQPESAYGVSKRRAETYILSQCKLPAIILRPTGVYGPREWDYYQVYKSIKMGIEFYVGSKAQGISFVHVHDLAALCLHVLASPIAGKAYFVSDLEHYTTLQFNQMLKTALNKKTLQLVVPKGIIRVLAWLTEKGACLFGKAPTLNTQKYYEISARNWYCDSSPLVHDFNYKPLYTLTEGLQHTLKWYKEHKLL